MKNYLSFLLIFLCCFGCKETARLTADQPADSLTQQKIDDAHLIAGNFSDQQVSHFDSAALPEFVKKYPDFASYTEDLEKFYRSRDYSYAWYDRKGLIEQATSLYNRIQNLNQEGLSRTLPYARPFQALMDDNDTLLQREPMNAEAELMLTAQYFSYARHVWQGIAEKETRQLEWYLPRKKLDLEQLMDSLLHNSNNAFITHEPVYRQYALLKSYLKKYRDIQHAGGWKSITAEKKSLRNGDSSQTILQIRKRLTASREFAGDTISMRYTEDLESSIKRFQESRGLTADGVIGSAAVRELNISVGDIVEKIILNMERSRWVPVSLSGEYLVVNIPSYKLYAYQNDSLVWDMNIVAGQALHQTVIFTGDLKYVVFSPYWNVPNSILQNEIQPAMRLDPDYLSKHNMEMVGNTVRQKPGPRNSLGQVKFLFPNSYSIYLHDTPSKSLFGKENRAFSHGCVRVSQPKELAMYLLRNSPEWTAAKINAAMNSGVEKYVTLKQTVPVLIAYFTAFVGRDGQLNLRPDVYDMDTRLSKMMLQ